MQSKRFGALVAAGTLSLGALVMPAQAAEYALAYSENDVQSVAGVSALHARIVNTAQNYCPGYFEIRSHREVRECVTDVVDDLVEKVDSPLLNAYHAGDISNQIADADVSMSDAGSR